MRPSWRARAARAAAAGIIALLPLTLPADAAPAPTPPNLGGWNVSADGNAVDIVLDNLTGLAGIHPFTEADFPEAESSFQTGPFASGLATIFWPGSAGGNFGSLSTELGLPAQIEPIVSKLNDPARALAEYPAGPTSSTYPAGVPQSGLVEMQTRAGPGGTTSTSDLVNQSKAGVLTLGLAKGTSSSTGSSSSVTASSSSEVSGISILGLVDIGGVTSTAVAASNGTTSSGSASTDVAGITVLGQKASIGSKGLVLPDLSNSALGPIVGPIVQNLLSQVISALGLQVTEFPATNTTNGASTTETSGGLSIEITPPSSVAPLLEHLASLIAPYVPKQAAIVPTLPGVLQGATLTLTLGRATASASASPPFSTGALPPPTGGFTPPATIPSVTTPASVAPASTAPSSAGSPTISSTPTTTIPPQAIATTPIAFSSPLVWGLVLLGVLVALAIGGGLWWMAANRLVVEDGPTICPLGKETP